MQLPSIAPRWPHSESLGPECATTWPAERRRVALRSSIAGVACRADGCLPSGGRARSESICTQVHGRPEPTSSSGRASESVTLQANRVRRDSEVKVSRMSLCEAKQCVCRVLYIWGPGGLKFTSVEHSCEMPSMNDDVPARDAEGRTSFYAENTVQSLYAQLGFRQAMASSHIVPRQLDEEIPSDDDACQEFETQDQEVPAVKIPERYRTCSGSRRKQQLWLDSRTNLSKS